MALMNFIKKQFIDVATIEKLHALQIRGIRSANEFDAKKAGLLKRLV